MGAVTSAFTFIYKNWGFMSSLDMIEKKVCQYNNNVNQLVSRVIVLIFIVFF